MDYLYLKDGRLRVWETFRDTTPQELFTYWTEPAKLRLWWSEEAASEAVPGRRSVLPGLEHTLAGTFSEVVPGQRLAFSWEHEPGTPARLVVVDFERREEDTLLTVTHGPYGSGEAEARERQEQLKSWQQLLGRLRAARRQP